VTKGKTNNKERSVRKAVKKGHSAPDVIRDLDEYRDVYQDLFDHVPCFITVQDRNYKLLRYNREFEESFDPKAGAHCYQAYKRRDEKCIICPVEKTFEDGLSHWSEEFGPNKHGETLHWVVKTSPIKNAKGEIIAVMEMCLDITHRKKLEEELEISERKYRAIFNNIPNPLFVLDAESLGIIDCNDSVETVYGYSREEMGNRSFLEFFRPEERESYASTMKSSTVINQARHLTKDGKALYVNIRISPSKHLGEKVLLVTTSDITQRLEIEQQLIQASKMATLGEMATGVAHELNQPLSVIKTASNFFVRKIDKKETIKEETLFTMSSKIDSNVDRATRIISHMREFGRKSSMNREKVQVNKVMHDAHDVMSQQLKLRGIAVRWDLDEDLPMIIGDAGRLEQVFINLLINARDAIEEKMEKENERRGNEKIMLKTRSDGNGVNIEVRDTGPGIQEDMLDKIFEPFFTTKKVGKGTGLGLSISYGIIKDCGGSIRVESNKKDMGACFVIKFPITDKK
jgi:histidine kinase